MPTQFRILPDRRLALFRFEGEIDTQECVSLFIDYVSDPAFDPRAIMLSDSRAVTAVHSDFRSIFGRVMALRSSLARFPNGAVSVIHARDDVVYGMARILQQVAEPLTRLRFRITRDEAEALAIAGQTETDFAALNAAAGTGWP